MTPCSYQLNNLVLAPDLDRDRDLDRALDRALARAVDLDRALARVLIADWLWEEEPA